MGFCAEHSAVAEMLKHGESVIQAVVTVDNDGNAVPPCGRCRELMSQLSRENLNAIVEVKTEYSRVWERYSLMTGKRIWEESGSDDQKINKIRNIELRCRKLEKLALQNSAIYTTDILWKTFRRRR